MYRLYFDYMYTRIALLSRPCHYAASTIRKRKCRWRRRLSWCLGVMPASCQSLAAASVYRPANAN